MDFIGLWASVWTLMYPAVVIVGAVVIQLRARWDARRTAQRNSFVTIPWDEYEDLLASRDSLKILDAALREVASRNNDEAEKRGG